MPRAGQEDKPTWQRVPSTVRRRIEAVLGARVSRALRSWGGYSPSATFRLALADGRRVFLKATYPLEPGRTYVNAGFWGTVHVGPDRVNAPRNRAIEAKVHELDGHKSLYSEAFYDGETFDALYDGANLARVKDRYDPAHRLTSLYDKAVRRR